MEAEFPALLRGYVGSLSVAQFYAAEFIWSAIDMSVERTFSR